MKTPLLFLYIHTFGILYAYVRSRFDSKLLSMTDIDFIRLSALVFAIKLMEESHDPVSEGVEMAERLFHKLNQKEV